MNSGNEKMEVAVIAAFSKNGRVIGKDSRIPWNIPEDLHRFKALTMGNAVIFGRKTFEGIGRTLPGRYNIVLSREPSFVAEGALKCSSLKDALEACEAAGFRKAFICGGQAVYEEGIKAADVIYATEVCGDFDGDRFFPEIDESVFYASEHEKHSGKIPFEYILYRKKDILKV